MNEVRQKNEKWLNPILNARITSHEITWTRENSFQSIQASGDLYFHKIPQQGTMPHCHDFSEILLVSSGSLIHRVNGERQHLTAGNIVFMRPDDMHGFAPDRECEKCEIVMLDFQLEIFLSMSIYFENDYFLQKMTAPVLPPCFKMDFASTSTLYSRMLKLNTSSVSPMLRKVKLKILLAELFARFFIDEVNFLSESQIPEWLENLCRTMRSEENFTAGLERMQKLAYRTPGHLCKSFQKYLGKTPTEFINELRINHAAVLLTDTNEDIVAIADKMKFQSLSRFYHLFRKYYGISPAAYRKLHTGRQDF